MVLCLLCFVPAAVFTQEKEPDKNQASHEEEPIHTLVDIKHVRFGGYGAPVVRFANIDNSLAVFMGGRGAAIINNSFAFGGAGYGMVYPKNINSSGKWSTIGYGGFLMEYYFFPKNVVNFSMGTIIGAGGSYDHIDSYSTFFVVEPEVNIFVNVTQFFRLGIGGSYRYTNGLSAGSLTDANFRGFTVGLLFEFGRF